MLYFFSGVLYSLSFGYENFYIPMANILAFYIILNNLSLRNILLYNLGYFLVYSSGLFFSLPSYGKFPFITILLIPFVEVHLYFFLLWKKYISKYFLFIAFPLLEFFINEEFYTTLASPFSRWMSLGLSPYIGLVGYNILCYSLLFLLINKKYTYGLFILCIIISGEFVQYTPQIPSKKIVVTYVQKYNGDQGVDNPIEFLAKYDNEVSHLTLYPESFTQKYILAKMKNRSNKIFGVLPNDVVMGDQVYIKQHPVILTEYIPFIKGVRDYTYSHMNYQNEKIITPLCNEILYNFLMTKWISKINPSFIINPSNEFHLQVNPSQIGHMYSAKWIALQSYKSVVKVNNGGYSVYFTPRGELKNFNGRYAAKETFEIEINNEITPYMRMYGFLFGRYE